MASSQFLLSYQYKVSVKTPRAAAAYAPRLRDPEFAIWQYESYCFALISVCCCRREYGGGQNLATSNFFVQNGISSDMSSCGGGGGVGATGGAFDTDRNGCRRTPSFPRLVISEYSSTRARIQIAMRLGNSPRRSIRQIVVSDSGTRRLRSFRKIKSSGGKSLGHGRHLVSGGV